MNLERHKFSFISNILKADDFHLMFSNIIVMSQMYYYTRSDNPTGNGVKEIVSAIFLLNV